MNGFPISPVGPVTATVSFGFGLAAGFLAAAGMRPRLLRRRGTVQRVVEESGR